MKFSFRLTLLTTLLLLLATTVSVIGVISYRHARFAANNMARELLEQAMERIEAQIENRLGLAMKLNALTERRMQQGTMHVDDADRFVSYALGALDIANELCGYFIGYESNGEATGVSRLTGKPSIWRSELIPARKVYEFREYWPESYPNTPYSFDPSQRTPDSRTRPWYEKAKSEGKSIWTDAFVFLGVKGTSDVHGVSYVTPIFGKDGKLLAVLDADFELNELSRFLATLDLGDTGYAYIVELMDDGTEQVVAHPNPKLLLRKSTKTTSDGHELIPPSEFADPRVVAFSAHVNKAKIPRNPDSSVTFRFLAEGIPYLGTMQMLDPATHPSWMICTVLPEEEVLGKVHQSVRETLFIGIGVFVISLIIGVLVAGQVSRPLEQLALEAKAIQDLQFRQEPISDSIVSEVHSLAVAMEDMKLGLRSFRKYIPPGLFQSFLTSKQEAVFGGEREVVTIFFSDIVNFTTIAETQRPEQLVVLLRSYLNTVCAAIETTEGTVDKYIGDAVMAFWQGGPAANNHARAACIAALECQAALDELNQRWEALGRAPFHTRIGLNTGEVVVGNIGSDTRFNYTIIGDAVNLSSRLEGLNKVYGTRILVSDITYHWAADAVVARPLDFVAVKGRQTAVVIYELLGLKINETDEQRQLVELSAQGLQQYRDRQWVDAIGIFSVIAELYPHDKASRLMLERCQAYLISPPEPNWDGSNRMTHK